MCDPLGDLITVGAPYSFSLCILFETTEDARAAHSLAYDQGKRGLFGEFCKITSLQPTNSFKTENMYSMYEYFHDTGLCNVNGTLLPNQTELKHSMVFWDLLKEGSRGDWSQMGDDDAEEAPFDLRSMQKFIPEHTLNAEQQECQNDPDEDNDLPWLQTIIAPSRTKSEPTKLSGKERKAEAALAAKLLKD